MNTEDVIRLIKESKKRTLARAFVAGDLAGIDWGALHFVGSANFGTVKGDLPEILKVLEANGDRVDDCEVEVIARNSAVPLTDLTKYEARIEPGAIIRDMVEIGKNAVVMMGAGAIIAGVGEPASAQPVVIEDGVLVGGNAVVLEGVRVGAGSVVAAGAVVTEDVPPGVVVAGTPARVIKKVDTKTEGKTAIVEALREL